MTLKTLLPELTDGQLAMLHRLISEEVIGTQPIYDVDDSMGKEFQAGYNDMAEATRIMRLEQKSNLDNLFGKGTV